MVTMLGSEVGTRVATGFAAELRRIMAARRLSGRQVAAYADVSPNTVNLWLRGAYTPTPRSLEKLAGALALPLDDLMRAAGHLPPEAAAHEEPEAAVVLDEDERTLIRWLRDVAAGGRVSVRRAYDVLRGLYHADDELFYDLGDPEKYRRKDEA